MLDYIHLENLICLDIETVPGYSEFSSLPDSLKELYLKKSERLKEENETPDDQYFNHAGIYAEFGKVICICMGKFRKENDEWHFKMKTISSDEEKNVLTDFAEIMGQHEKRREEFQFCGHNIREFDIPYLCRRMLVHGIKLPAMLDLSGKKPWEIGMVDTMQLWKFGDIKHYTSLKLLAAILGIDSPKDDIDGKDVGRVYWKENDLKRIVSYCQRDVVTVAQLILKFRGIPLLAKENITVVDA